MEESALTIDQAVFWSCALAHMAGIVFGVVLYWLLAWPARLISRILPTAG